MKDNVTMYSLFHHSKNLRGFQMFLFPSALRYTPSRIFQYICDGCHLPQWHYSLRDIYYNKITTSHVQITLVCDAS